jgi:hypothetical protein
MKFKAMRGVRACKHVACKAASEKSFPAPQKQHRKVLFCCPGIPSFLRLFPMAPLRFRREPFSLAGTFPDDTGNAAGRSPLEANVS